MESSCPCPAHDNCTIQWANPPVLKLPIRGYVLVKSASQRHWRKWVGAAELECAQVFGGILYNTWYLLDSKDTYQENPKRLLLTHGGCQNFRVE